MWKISLMEYYWIQIAKKTLWTGQTAVGLKRMDRSLTSQHFYFSVVNFTSLIFHFNINEHFKNKIYWLKNVFLIKNFVRLKDRNETFTIWGLAWRKKGKLNIFCSLDYSRWTLFFSISNNYSSLKKFYF